MNDRCNPMEIVRNRIFQKLFIKVGAISIRAMK